MKKNRISLLKRQFDLFGHISSESLTVRFNSYVKLVCELKADEVELDNIEVSVSQPKGGVALMTPVVESVPVVPQFVRPQVQHLRSELVIAKVHINKHYVLSKMVNDIFEKQIQQKAKNDIGYKVVPPFNGNRTFIPESKLDTSHVHNFSTSVDPVVSSSPEERKSEKDCETGNGVSESVCEFADE
ncbi:hypothetical protein L1987_06924 [Smallanthus sonchifolius]|uniref:Uncharacterized protein n=1 Tax=Smallanthus sonchifolius TaxID=185202 RepID=A0ACB9JZM4_9ASTR|nr:hypothetical protein L1987_06924 [Smallanthus sonchifolius]